MTKIYGTVGPVETGPLLSKQNFCLLQVGYGVPIPSAILRRAPKLVLPEASYKPARINCPKGPYGKVKGVFCVIQGQWIL